MKILLYTDNHWCQYSSIIRDRGDKYSNRLENQIASINWVEDLAYQKSCEKIICLGDFFDTPSLNAEEITALKEIRWSTNADHYFLTGNHEMGTNDLTYSSSQIFESLQFNVIKVVDYRKINDNVGLIFLPYLLKDRRNTLKNYINDLTIDNKAKNYIVLSHNDISGIRYGQYLSKDGFDIEDIYNNCRLFINGHLHNQTQINEKILNLGNLTGQNFSEDASHHSHCAAILDTDTFEIELINNPYAFNFYKFEITNEDQIQECYNLCKENSVVSIKTYDKYKDKIKQVFNNPKTVDGYLNYRIIIIPEIKTKDEESVKDLITTDHITQFTNYIINELGESDIVKEELNLIK